MIPLTVVVAETAKLNPPTESVDPFAILIFAQAAFAVIVIVLPPSINTLSPATGKLAPLLPPELDDHEVFEFQFPVAIEYLVAAANSSEKHNKRIAGNKILQVSSSLYIVLQVQER
jgi:hypothetical protein